MSSSTPNLNLVLPVGGEHVSRAIINENNTKIDMGFGTLSEQIGTKVGYDIVDIYTGNVLEASAGLYRCPSTAPNLPIASNGYLTVITRSTTLTLLQFVADNGRMFINTRNSSSWTGWEELAMNSGTNMARTAVSITSDTAIIDWEPGTYTTNDATAATNGYIPSRYGSIIVNKAAGLYGSCFFVTTNGSTVFVRSFHKSNKTWYTGWQQLVTSSDSRSTINDGITYASGMEPTEQYSGMYTYHKTVEFVFYDNKSSPSTYTEGKLIGTISSAYRCTRGFYVPFFETDNSAVVGSVYISPTGTVKYYGQTITTKGVFHAMWMIP